MKFISISTFLVLLPILPSSSFAWGPAGHRIIATIAEHHLNQETRLRIRELLGSDEFGAISVWADDIKGERPETFGWHFVDIPVNSSGFSEARDCYHPDTRHPETIPDHHNCVVDRILLFKHVLTDKAASQPARVEALKFLVHFVGDLHQPMHAIAEGRGGNDIRITEFGASECGRRPCNLHFAWDIGLIEHAHRREVDYGAHLEALIAQHAIGPPLRGSPADWANESFVLARKVWINQGGSVDESYYKSNIDVLDGQLARAGLRLANLLNEALGGRSLHAGNN
jgi:S1/P1 Nuclease